MQSAEKNNLPGSTVQKSDRIHILHIISINGLGGAELLVAELLPGLAEQGVTVSCMIFHHQSTPQAATRVGTILKERGIQVFLHSYKHVFQRNILQTIRKQVHSEQYDIIHSHLKYSDLWVALLRKTGRLKLPVITTLHGYNDGYQNKYGLQYNRKARYTSYYWLSRFVYSSIDRFIIISKVLHQFYQASGLLKNKPTHIVYHGCKTDDIPALPSMRSGKIDHPKIAVPGRLIALKGHRYAFDAMELLNDRFSEWTMDIFGTGPEEAALKEYVGNRKMEKHVFFQGHVNNMINRLQEYDIVLLPTLAESFGLVFLEAFKAGVPVVGFDLPAGNEIVVNDENGLLAVPYSAASLAEQVVRICSEPGLREKLVRQGRERLINDFSISKMATSYKECYKEMIG